MYKGVNATLMPALFVCVVCDDVEVGEEEEKPVIIVAFII